MRVPNSLQPSVSAWRRTLRDSSARRLAVFMESREAFAAVLLAAWAERKQVVIPGDNLSATAQALETQVDAFVGDFAGYPTLAPSELVEGPAESLALDMAHEGVVVFTSGSTGAPTAILKRLGQLFAEVQTLEATFGAQLHPDARIISTVSHQHIYGLLCAVLWPLVTGRALTPQRLEYPEEVEPALLLGPCVLISSPAHLKRLPPGRRWQTQHLGAVFSSGGPLTDEGAERAHQVLGHWPIELYGSSETGGIAWRQRPESAWKPLAGVLTRASVDGLLEVQSPHLYDSSWFTTADQVQLGRDSFVLVGRADRLAKIEEKRVSLDLIERLAVGTGLVTQARVVVLDGPRVTLGLVGVLSAAGQGLERKALIAHLKGALEGQVERVAFPRRFRFVEALPMNEQGKVTQSLLQALFVPLRPEARWLSRESTQAVLEVPITPDLKVLEGHFPATPIVPGVAQVHWAVGWGQEAFPIKGSLSRLEVIKFQALLRPGHIARLQLDWNQDKQTLTFKYAAADVAYSSGRVVFV